MTAEGLKAELWTADHRLMDAFQGKKPAWMHFIDEIEI